MKFHNVGWSFWKFERDLSSAIPTKRSRFRNLPSEKWQKSRLLATPTPGIGPSLPRGSGPPPRRPRVGRLFARVAEEAEEQLLERVGAVAAAAVAAAVCRGQLCKNMSSRKIDSQRLFSRE